MADAAPATDYYGGLTQASVGNGIPKPLVGVVLKAMQQYPVIQKAGAQFVYTPNNSGNGLEFWPAGEPGSKDYPRPTGLPIGQPGIQIIKANVRPEDVAGDIVSHDLRMTDRKVSAFYKQFLNSLTAKQKEKLQNDYQWARKNEGETRPFTQWADMARLPAYFRAYPFQQWPQGAINNFYTPDQKKMLDRMVEYLRTGG